VRDVAVSLKLSPKRFLMPLSYIVVLGGTCTLIGTSTNLLVNDMARSAGQPAFSLFEITPVGLSITVVGTLYVLLVAPRLLGRGNGEAAGPPVSPVAALESEPPGIDSSVADASVFVGHYALKPVKAALSLGVFVAVVTVAALGWAPIAASAFAGAVLLILLRVVSAEEAYKGLRPEILMLIAGMVVIGLSLELSGLAGVVTEGMVAWVKPFGPRTALILFYGATLLLTEILSNAAVAVLVTPLAVGLAESLGVSPRPFLVAVMMAGSAAFATPFGYQTNVIVYEMGRYNYMDFVRLGVPLNLLTWAVAVLVIPAFFPF
jgi:di/tricarboxylate transporter